MAAASHDLETGCSLRDFLLALHCDLQASREAFPSPAVNDYCRELIEELAPNFGADTDPELVDKIGEELLIVVSQHGCTDMARSLLALGVNSNYEMDLGEDSEDPEDSPEIVTPLLFAALRGQSEVTR